MESVFLTSLPLNYADSVKFEHDGRISKVIIANEEQNLSIILSGIISFSVLSNGFSNEEDYLDFVDIQHEYRQINSDELQKYGFAPYDTISENRVHIISIYGNVTFQLICRTVESRSTGT